MGFLGNLLKGGGNEKVKEMLQNGAVVVDVRSRGEFQGGHVAGSKNIPLDELEGRLNEIKKIGKPLVLCCASGMRSGRASSFLKSQGVDCENGGGWTSVNSMI
ncbi:MAG: rhodanese-like domain-containing protein [Flavobacteriales bacterium]|jgi:rhodanese-related sulfurtransferase|nr:rhodanese-like domain-containing protein [Flavobacteriales bacterium]